MKPHQWPLVTLSLLLQYCMAVTANTMPVPQAPVVSSVEAVDQSCSATGALLGLCEAGFALGCESSCVEGGSLHANTRCRILNRKYNEHSTGGVSVDAPWLTICPCRTSHVGSFTDKVFAMDRAVVSPSGEFVFTIGQQPSSLAVVDVGTDPFNPSVIARLLFNETENNVLLPTDIAVSNDGQFVFVIGEITDSLSVVNVTDPMQPTQVGFLADYTKMDHPVAIAVAPEGNVVFVTGYESNTVAVIDTSSPTTPLVSSFVGGEAPYKPTKIAMSSGGDTLYVMTASSFQVWTRVHSDYPLKLSGSLQVSTASTVANVAAWPNGTFAFTTDSFPSTLQAIDVSTPSAPASMDSILGNETFMVLPSAVTASINGRFLYVTDSLGTLIIVRINVQQQGLTLSVNEVFPVLQGEAKHGAQSADGQYVYVLGIPEEGSSSFHVVKVCDS
eukprot:INCI10710.1.p1 GENE.INCI10710.1~~INCI10710.1.p1  ORF type:complete len:444 (-),score=58.58 INCI10710.1:507-1838(-)